MSNEKLPPHPAPQLLLPTETRLVPPPASDHERRNSEPPVGSRTPSQGLNAPTFAGPLPPEAPGWMRRARRMAAACEYAIRSGRLSPSVEASLERAWAAWELGGAEDQHVARTATLLQRAYEAMHQPGVQLTPRLFHDCAQVVWTNLPTRVQERVTFDQAARVVHALHGQPNSWSAVVEATAELFGWSASARSHAAHAVRVAVEDDKP